MNDDDKKAGKVRNAIRKRGTLLAVGTALAVAVASFATLSLLPSPKGRLFEDPLRSLLTGLCVLGVATPLCISGSRLKKRFACSPYFEGAFIAAVLSVFGFLCAGVGLVCIGLGLYDLAKRFLG